MVDYNNAISVSYLCLPLKDTVSQTLPLKWQSKMKVVGYPVNPLKTE